MAGIPPLVLLWFVSSALLQILGVAMLPLSQGFTKPIPSIVCVAAMSAGMYLLARIVRSGVDISTLVPFLAATMPLITIVIGIVAYGEAASPLKIGLLVVACGIVGLAARVG